jgi:tryptophanyl-tRNA synthetase
LADLHSLTTVHDGETLRRNKKEMLLDYFSLIPEDRLEKITIYEQSKVERINDMNWVLNSVTPYSLMLRAHSFKDAKNKNSEVNMATFNYPILMAADIISYDYDIVPL